MDFLKSEFSFKSASRAVERLLKQRGNAPSVTPDELLTVLLPVARLPNGDRLVAGTVRLAEHLNASSRTVLRQPELQQLLSLSFTQAPYQRLHARLKRPTDFRSTFDDIRVAPCYISEGERIEHPFPTTLRGIEELAAWREAWEECAFSTKTRPFFPPMLPVSYFEGRGTRYEYRRDWVPSVGRVPLAANGRCCVLVRDRQNKIIGSASWFWWGHRDVISGVGYSLALCTNSKWLHVYFDIRPDRFEPTCGPVISREKGDSCSSFIGLGLLELQDLAPPTSAD